MGLRPARTIRDVDKVPWTRWSRRVMKKSYIKAMPHKDLHHFMHGKWNDDYNACFHLIAKDDFYHRDNAIESARQAVVRYLEKNAAGKFMFLIRVYPHHIIRENKMVAGAGADRIQKGMRRAFGKPTDRAARVRPNQPIFTIYTYNEFEDVVKTALERAARKLSGRWKIERDENVNR